MVEEKLEANRPWLHPNNEMDLHYFGFKKHNWNPSKEHGVYLYDQETIEYCLRRAKFFSDNGDMNASKEEYANLAMKAPNNIMVLEKCMEFECKQGNSTAAEEYLCCLICLATDKKAYIEKRAALLPNVDHCDDFRAADIEQFLEKYKNLPPISDEILETRKNSFIARLTYNTLAIEGNKLSVDDVQAIKNDRNRALRVKEGMDSDHLEVHGMLDVLNYIERKEYTIKDLCENFDLEELNYLHSIMLRDKPNDAGKLRQKAVWFDGVPFEPIDFKFVPEQMAHFFKFLRTIINQVEKNQMNAMECATLGHYYLLHIHPYRDGNGRMSRLLLNILLAAYGIPPIIVPFVERRTYILALNRAHMGDLRTLIRLISHYVRKTLLTAVQQQMPFPVLDTDVP